MKKKKVMIRSLITHTSIFCLLISLPTPNSVLLGQIPVSSLAGTGVGIIQAVGQQVLQAKQQQAALQNQTAVMQGMRVQLRPARYFPQCRVPQSKSGIPENACENIASPGQLGMVIGLQRAALANRDLFDQMMSLKQNTPRPAGLQCIDEARKQADSSMRDRINALTALQTRINKETQLFKEDNKRLIEEMSKDNAILNGGRGANSLDIKSENLAKNFSSGCQNLNGGIGGINKSIRQGGLLGILNGKMDDFQSKANTYRSNEIIFKKDVDTMIQRMVQNMTAEGIENFQMNSSQVRGLSPGVVSRVDALMKEQSRELEKYKTQTQIEITKLGINYQIPSFDRNFSIEFEEFNNGASNFFQKQFINECVTGSTENSIGLSSSDILKSLRQRTGSRGSRGGGTTLRDYREALSNILDTDSFLEDKLAQIRALDNKFSSGRSRIEIRYTNNDAVEVTTSPYDLYMETVETCKKQFGQNNTFSAKNARSISMKNKVKRLQGYLNKLKRKHDTFLSDAANQVSNALINCNGAQFKTGAESCNPDSLSPSSQGFSCLSHSSKCASQVNACFGQITSFVEEKKQELKQKADVYNQNLGNLVVRQERLLAAIKNQVTRDAEFIKNFFPGAVYKLPANLFVSLPPLSDQNEFGVPLRGNPEDGLKFLQSLPGNIEKLKNQLLQQGKGIAKAVKEYADRQEVAMGENREKWENLRTKCSEAEKAFRNRIAETHKKNTENFQKRKSEVYNFCSSFMKVRSRAPSDGACGEVEDLYSESNKVAAHINGDVLSDLLAYQKICDQREGAKNSSDDEDDDDKKGQLLSRKCEKYGGKWDRVKVSIVESTLRNIPTDISLQKIKKFIEGKGEMSNDLEKKIKAYTGLMKNIRAVRNLLNIESELMKDNLLTKDQWIAELSKDEDVKKKGEDEKDKQSRSLASVIKKLKLKKGSEKNPCTNLENELIVAAYNECQGQASCSQRKTKKELKESFENLPRSIEFNKTLKTANTGRAFASSSDWSLLGENKSDACEVTASKGRNFGGFDLNAFDIETGAVDLGDFGFDK